MCGKGGKGFFFLCQVLDPHSFPTPPKALGRRLGHYEKCLASPSGPRRTGGADTGRTATPSCRRAAGPLPRPLTVPFQHVGIISASGDPTVPATAPAPHGPPTASIQPGSAGTPGQTRAGTLPGASPGFGAQTHRAAGFAVTHRGRVPSPLAARATSAQCTQGQAEQVRAKGERQGNLHSSNTGQNILIS